MVKQSRKETAQPLFRDRIRELRRVPARDLVPSPANWRKHSEAQRATLRGVLSEVGYAEALVARELPDGRLELIDGHLRAETTPDQIVPVLILDVNEAEAKYLLATLDPIAGLATTDTEALAALLRQLDTRNEAVQELFDGMTDPRGAGKYNAVERLADMISGESEWNPDPATRASKLRKQIAARIDAIPADELDAALCVIIPREGRREAIIMIDPDLHDIVLELRRRRSV